MSSSSIDRTPGRMIATLPAFEANGSDVRFLTLFWTFDRAETQVSAERAGDADTVGMGKRLASILLACVAVVCMAAVPAAATGQGETACWLVASPTGSDSAPGTFAAPFRTAQKLVSSLHAGQTGCLEGGTYDEDVTFRDPGTTLIADPGQTATIVGRVYVAEGANDTTVTGLDLNGQNAGQQLSPMVDANQVTFSYDDVTNDHTGTCFGIGSATWGWATGTVITHDRVHGCGQEVPGDNYQHGFYIGGATDTTIEWNLIYGNAARGIQLYPDAENTTIDHNIISGNGEGILIGGEGGAASSNTNVYDNVISDATTRHDVESYWPAGNPVGVDNSVHDNCLWGGREGTLSIGEGGATASHNLDANPQFVDAKAGDYELNPTSPCLAIVGDVQAAIDGTTPQHPVMSRTEALGRVLAHTDRHRRHRQKHRKRSRRRGH
jgi:parallel beta-helix repeat protein